MLGRVFFLIVFILMTGVTACTQATETSLPATNDPEPASIFTIDQLQPKILPYVFTDRGTWIVKPVQTKEKDRVKALKSLEKTLHIISARLKPFPTHRDEQSIIPKIKITPITISKQGRSVKTLGWFDSEYNAIVLTWDIVRVGEEALQYAFSHELGHWVWYYVLTDREKEKYRGLVNGNKAMEYHNDLKDPGYSSDLLVEEWFADDFRVYACEVPDYPHLLHTPIGKSPGEPARLKEFFHRFKADNPAASGYGAEHNLFPETSGADFGGKCPGPAARFN